MNEYLNNMLHYINENMNAHAINCKVGNTPTHWHSFYEMEYIYEGEGILHVNGNDFEFSTGTIHFVTPNDFHAYTFTKKTIIKNVSFHDIYFEKNSIASNTMCSGFKIMHLSSEQVEWYNLVFDKILYDENSVTLYKQEYLIHMLNLILIDFARASNMKINSSYHIDDPIQHSAHYIQTHFREQLSLESVANIIALSPNYFCSEFKKATGMTFKKYLNTQRLSYAVKLLKNTDLSITEVAETCGFNSISYFLKVFQNQYNMTPKAYKNTVLKNKS